MYFFVFLLGIVYLALATVEYREAQHMKFAMRFLQLIKCGLMVIVGIAYVASSNAIAWLILIFL